MRRENNLCLSEDHLVLLLDGTWCPIENIKVGDRLMGPCTVLSVVPVASVPNLMKTSIRRTRSNEITDESQCTRVGAYPARIRKSKV